MIDLHCHLLPGVDDGPDTLEEAVALCRHAVASGITHSVVTPHVHPGRYENDARSIPAVLAVHSTNGKWDLIVELATQTLLELDDVIHRIRNIEGVITSETNLLLSTRKAGRR